jgi:hypothetical protein
MIICIKLSDKTSDGWIFQEEKEFLITIREIIEEIPIEMLAKVFVQWVTKLRFYNDIDIDIDQEHIK